MNSHESDIETVLRGAPCPGAPEGLKKKLLLGVPRNPGTSWRSIAIANSRSGWFRRWWPALAPAAVSAACAVVLTAQQMEINDLRQSLATLIPAALVQPTRVPVSVDTGVVSSASQPLIQEDEMARLKQAVAQLTSDINGLEQMRSENEKLRAQIAAAAGNSLTDEELQAMNEARDRAMRIQCVNNLKQIGLAVRMWALDNKDIFPTNFICMSNELSTPKILVCPADTNRVSADNFSSFTDANCSYDLFFGSDTEPDQVLSRCHVHNNVGLCDGSVQMINPDRLEERNGKLYLKRTP